MTLKNAALAYFKHAAGSLAAPTFTNTAGSRLRLQRLVNENLNTNQQRDESNEVRGDAQSSGSTITSVSASGSVSLQYSLDTYDDFLVALLYANDVNDAGTGREDGWLQGGFTAQADILATPGSVTFQFADGSLNGTFLRAPTAGERIYVRGFGNKNLDTIWQVASGATTSKIVLENDTGMADVATYAGLAANLTATAVTVLPVKGYTRNGTFERRLGLVRMYTDVDQAGTTGTSGLNATDWALFRGGVPNSLQLAVAPGQAGWTGTLSFLLSDEAIVQDATATSNLGGFRVTNWNQVQVVNTNPLVNPIQSVLMVKLRKVGAAVTAATRVDPLSYNINIANNASEIQATRNAGAVAINQGSFQISVGMSLLYIDPTYHRSMLQDEAYEVEIGVADANGLAQLWRFPAARLTSERPNPGKNQPIAQNLTFSVEAGGAPFAFTGFTNTTLRMVEVLSFYTRTL